MARNDKRIAVTLECQTCKRRNYITTKNKVNDRERIELKKFCKWDRDPHAAQGDPLSRGPPGGAAASPGSRNLVAMRGSNSVTPDDMVDLVLAAKDGDRASFDELVRLTYAETYTLAFRLTGDEEDARDVVQESYLRAYRGLKRFRGDAQFTTWLYRITSQLRRHPPGPALPSPPRGDRRRRGRRRPAAGGQPGGLGRGRRPAGPAAGRAARPAAPAAGRGGPA